MGFIVHLFLKHLQLFPEALKMACKPNRGHAWSLIIYFKPISKYCLSPLPNRGPHILIIQTHCLFNK